MNIKFLKVLKISIFGIFETPCLLFLKYIGISQILEFFISNVITVSMKKLYPLDLIFFK